jgi:hypothetical protein
LPRSTACHWRGGSRRLAGCDRTRLKTAPHEHHDLSQPELRHVPQRPRPHRRSAAPSPRKMAKRSWTRTATAFRGPHYE